MPINKTRGSPASSQVRNANRPRPNRQANVNYPQQQRNTCADVNGDPVSRSAFTVELAIANQCLDNEPLPVEDPALRTLITNRVADELRKMKMLTNHDGVDVLSSKSGNLNAVIDAIAGTDALDDVFILRTVNFGQLHKKSCAPDLSMREHHKNDKTYVPAEQFETYQVPESNNNENYHYKLYCQAPAALGGWHAEVVTERFQKFRLAFEFEVKVGNEFIGVKVTCNQRPKDHVYNAETKCKEQCVKVQIGSFDVDDKFVAASPDADAIYTKIDWKSDFFVPSKWKSAESEYEGGGEEHELDESKSRFTFVNEDFKICLVSENDDTIFKTPLANFAIDGVPHIYTFDDPEMQPLYEIICTKYYSDAGEPITIGPNDLKRNPRVTHCSTLTVHALINLTVCHTKRDVLEQFQRQCDYLLTDGMTAEMLINFISQQADPKPLHMIDKWGLQDDGWWVLGNCAFKDAELVAINESGHSVYHRYFTHNAYVSMSVSNFPKILICPIPHLRYFIGCLMWNRLMRPYFANNEQPAKAVFCTALLGMHAHDFWNMVGSLHGAPTLWAVSREPGSGKSESFKLAQEVVGSGHRALWGGDATKPATFDASVMDSGIIRFIDDVVVAYQSRNGPESSAHQEIVRGFFDRTGRQVCGKPERAPNSTIGYSSNSVINIKDHPFQSRLLTLEYKPLQSEHADYEWGDFTETDYLICRKLMSCLMPDLEMIGKWNGSIDSEAITDLVTWFESVQKVKRNRPCANNAKLAFIELNMIKCFGGGEEDTVSFLDWFINDVTRTVCELNKHPGIIDQFLLALIEVRDKVSPNVLGPNPDRVIYWHNFRTQLLPENFIQMPNQTVNHGYWAIRVGQVTNVIQNVLGRAFDEREIYNAVKNSPNVKDGVRGTFYDTMRGWPLKKTIIAGTSDVATDVPIEEDELLSETLIRSRCIFVKKDHILSLYKTVQGDESDEQDYKHIVIKSCVPGIADYNMYDMAVSGDWFGYRTLDQCSFSHFCGAKNKIYCGGGTCDPLLISKDIEREHRELGIDSVMNCFSPQYILNLLNYDNYQMDAYPPCWMKMPFQTRDAADDTYVYDPLTQYARDRYEYYDPTMEDYCDTDDAKRKMTPPDTGVEYKHAKRARRASPSNQARYPRPPTEIKTLDDVIAMGRYTAAGGAVESSEERDELDEFGDLATDDVLDFYEEPLKVKLSVRIMRFKSPYILSCKCPHSHHIYGASYIVPHHSTIHTAA